MTTSIRKTIRIAGSDAESLCPGDPVQLSCGTEGCPSNCCKNGPHIILNPYEIARICTASGMSYEDLLDIVETDRANGFPLVMLPRDPFCHFWTDAGCRIYDSRPLACRLFPLGRVFEDGASHFVLPDRNICTGLAASPERTLEQYLAEQDTACLIAMADRWIEFVTEMEHAGLPDKPVTSVAFHMLVYSPDTPPSDDSGRTFSSSEERFLVRLETARRKLPRFLRPF
ncbi:MAG: YkgJ family cysteine cluster protein [Nitrospiraceae bacterium]|nr:YkgJ family cysteine cluster protein [Nitrospiraceae bacterium]